MLPNFSADDDGTDANRDIDWERLSQVTQLCTQFLDNVVDAGHFPLPEIDDVVKRTRPVGLGIMGFADLCLSLGITYGGDESIDLMEKVMGFVRRESWLASLRLGQRKGRFSGIRSQSRGLFAVSSMTSSAYRATFR